MAPRTLSAEVSLDLMWTELTYTRARIAADGNAKDLAPQFDPLIAEVEETRIGQRRTWQGLVEAQAACDHLNGKLDDLVIEFADTLHFTLRDRKSPRAERYLTQTPYSIVRMALGSEVELIRGWPDSLKTEPEESLKAFAARFAEMIQQADAAQAALRSAESARLDHRVRVITPLVTKLNNLRLKAYGVLVGRAEEKSLGKYWPDGFFRVGTRRTPDQPEDPVPPVDPVKPV